MLDERRLAEPNVGMVIGFVLICVSVLALIILCCCFRGNGRAVGKQVDDEAPDLVETDSSGSESSKDKSALSLFLKGRQAGMAEGLRDEYAEAYAVGYMDGTHFASERKETLTDTQVMKQAKKLDYSGHSANAYVQGFQNGVRSGMSTESSDQRHGYESGLLNADSRGLSRKDRDAYAKGYAAGDTSGKRLSDADVMAKAEKVGFTGPHAELFAAGYADGVNGINVTDVLSSAAAFQKGLSKAATLNLVENDAFGHATGFRDGYAFALVGNGSTTVTKSELEIKSGKAGFTGIVSNRFCKGFEEGIVEGHLAYNRLIQKGSRRAENYGMLDDFKSAFSVGYKDGCVNAASGISNPGDQSMRETAKGLKFQDDDKVNAYIRGYTDGAASSSKASKASKTILLPEYIFENEFMNARAQKSDEEAAAARASGRHDGYCYGLTGGALMAKHDILDMAFKLGFQGHDSDIYASSFQSGAIEGSDAREIALLKGKRKASSLDISGDAGTAYSNGYGDGLSHVISGEDIKKMSESALKMQAKTMGFHGKLAASYINGFQDGQRDGNEITSPGHVFSSDASYAKGLLDARSQAMSGETSHAYACGYSEGYQSGIDGTGERGKGDARAIVVERRFTNKKAQKACKKGYADGFDDGSDARLKQTGRILSPCGAIGRGLACASSNGLGDDACNAYAIGFGDGYTIGLAGHQCPKDKQLNGKATDCGFTDENQTSYTSGFHHGWKEGGAVSVITNARRLSPDAALKKGLEKAAIHGIGGATAQALGTGHRDGYAFGLKQTEEDFAQEADPTRDELAQQARSLGNTDMKLTHAYIAGYLSGHAAGGVVVRFHSLCDVHKCTSNTCQTCRNNTKGPAFLQIPHGYMAEKEKSQDKSWWNLLKDVV
jgi:hypothetical protein